MPSIQLGKTKINYTINRSFERETVGVAVDPQDGVIVTVPNDLQVKKIDAIVKDKAGWILDKIYKFDEIKDSPIEKEFLSGEKLKYIGRRYRLKLIKESNRGKISIKLKQGTFYVYISDNLTEKERKKKARKAFIDWYYEHGEKILAERVDRYKDQVGVNPNQVKVRDQLKRWGSCTKTKNLIYNWRIIMAPMSIIDYVVVHELCHLKEQNHTELFWRMLKSVITDYEKRKDWLRINGPKLDL